MERKYDVFDGYLPVFIQHFKDTRRRLGSQVDSQDNEVRISAEDNIGEGAEPHAPSGWTPAELDALFRAVSVHSRWRPDLITASVPTKTKWEVWMYLEALEEGVVALTMQADDGEDAEMEGDRDVEMQVDGSTSHSGSDVEEAEDEDEELCEPAFEVSQKWIDAEERMAFWVIDREHIASLKGDAVADAAAAKDQLPKRARGRPVGCTKRRAQSKVRAETVSDEGSPPAPDHQSPSLGPTSTSPNRSPSADLAQRREALMCRLQISHLLALDSILREGDEVMRDASNSREVSVMVATSMEHGDDGALRTRGGDVMRLSDRITRPLGASNASDVATQGPSSLPNDVLPDTSSQPGADNMVIAPQDGAIPKPDLDANDEELALLSPRSRRRIQKRLYMRRKRAMLRGDNVASNTTLDTGIAKFKPGKKVKSSRTETSVARTPVPCSEASTDSEAEPPEDVPKKKKGGLTLPYKLKAQFTELGVDAAYLRDQGMHLLNLGALGRLTGLYISLELDEANEATIAQSIDAQLIQYLQACMVTFVTDVIHKAIVWREREIRLKQRNRAWRPSGQIAISAVEHAVTATGARYHSHKAYFKSLEELYDLSTEASPAPSTAAEPNSRDASVDPDAEAADLPVGLSVHRNMYTPVVCPPSAWKQGPMGCLTRIYEREATRTRRGASAEIDGDELMPDETDEEALGEELGEEDGVDEEDMAASVAHEEELWGKIKK